MNSKRYMTTGELAKMMHITKNTLFHYDNIGLFSPEIKGENDYRYYGVNQLNVLNIILLLKELNMSLSDIKDFLNHRSQGNLLELFHAEEKVIDKEIEKLKDKKNWIKHKRNDIININNIDLSKIYIVQCPTKYYIESSIKNASEQSCIGAISNLMANYEKYNSSICYDIGYIQRNKTVDNMFEDNYESAILLVDKKPKGLKYHTLESGEYIIAYHQGHFLDIGNTYKRLFDFAAKNKIKIHSDFLEMDVVDYLTTEKADNFITKIEVKIIKG